MEFIENLDDIRIARPMEPKWIRADSLWSRISGNMFFSTEEKKKIRFMIETEPAAPAHWIDMNHEIHKCSNCGNYLDGDANYCPNCGKKMNKETK